MILNENELSKSFSASKFSLGETYFVGEATYRKEVRPNPFNQKIILYIHIKLKIKEVILVFECPRFYMWIDWSRYIYFLHDVPKSKESAIISLDLYKI